MTTFIVCVNKLYLLLFFTSLFIYGQQDAYYQSSKFFEDGPDAAPRDERSYSTVFSQNTSRYIWYEVKLGNNLYNIRDNYVTLKAKYYYPDGRLMGEPVQNFTIPSDWETAYLWNGWGWEESGNWNTGTHRVEIYLNGDYVDTKAFTISDEISRQYSNGGEETWDGDWRGTIYYDKNDESFYVRIVINGNTAVQYFQNDDGYWDPVDVTDEMISEYYRNNYLMAWINHGEVWTETQAYSLSWLRRGAAEVVWTRHVNNKREGENETWYIKGTGTLIRQ